MRRLFNNKLRLGSIAIEMTRLRHRFRIARRGATDLEEIAEYIGQRNPSAADRVIDELFHSFAQLADNPDFGISLDELRPTSVCFSRPNPHPNTSFFTMSYPTES
jgi:plasmid stabilization system protein ParE